jgi:hypothetical protein
MVKKQDLKSKEKSAITYKIDGFPMHQEELDAFRFLKNEGIQPPASAYVVYLTMMKQLQTESSKRGILKDYKLSFWAKNLNIPYSSLYYGYQFLRKYVFFSEEIMGGVEVLHFPNIEKLNNPESNRVKDGSFDLNYLTIPNYLLETNVLAELVRTSNSKTIELLFSLLNQFRAGLRQGKITNTSKTFDRNIKTLKSELNKKAKGVRSALNLLSPILDITYINKHMRGMQLWIEKVSFALNKNCFVENTANKEIHPLLATMSKEFEYFLSRHSIAFKGLDLRNIVTAFRFEILENFKKIPQEKEFNFEYLKASKDYVSYTLHYLEKLWLKEGRPTIRVLGAYFRKVFRGGLNYWVYTNVPEELLYDIKFKQLTEKGLIDDFLKPLAA